jgi:hypothetical protein
MFGMMKWQGSCDLIRHNVIPMAFHLAEKPGLGGLREGAKRKREAGSYRGNSRSNSISTLTREPTKVLVGSFVNGGEQATTYEPPLSCHKSMPDGKVAVIGGW